MNQRITTLIALIVLTVPVARAQTDVTIREINAIPQAGIDAVKALGGDVTSTDIQTHIRSDWTTNISSPDPAKLVRFDAVVLSDPRYSGLSSINSGTGMPSRVHIFVRDVSAATDGPAGNDLQVVDGNYQTTGTLTLFVGDVVRLTGYAGYFGTGLQFSPESVEFLGTIADLSIPETILDPVLITADQLNVSTGDFLVRLDWDSFNDLNQQYVRIEGLQVWQSPNRSDGRPNWAVRDTGTNAIIQNEDFSLAYRNDKTDYPDPPFFATNDFVAPPPGASVNVQGFALLSRTSSFDPFLIGDPIEAIFKIVPWTPDDLVITSSPPNISNAMNPDGVIANAPATVSATVTADPSRTLTEVKAIYSTTSNATEFEVAGVSFPDDVYAFDIPAQADGDFVVWRVEATDSDAATSVTDNKAYRVLWNGIQNVSDIQTTADGGEGDSPFRDLTTSMDLEVTIQTDPANAGTGSNDVVAVQDGTGPWSGISLRNSGAPLAGMAPGDVIRITEATITEAFGLTQIRDYTFEIISQVGSAYDPVVVGTDALQDPAIAEAHEGMFIRVENVVVTSSNADAPSAFGEFEISSDGTEENAIRVNDQSTAISYTGNDPATMFSVGERLEFVQGSFWYSFSNFKIEPGTFDDIGPVINVATEGDELPRTTALHQNFPNPFNPTTSIQFDLAQAGPVRLDVYDSLGRLVKSLVDEERPAGTHAVRFDASKLASGLYLYRLSTSERSVARTMLLIK